MYFAVEKCDVRKTVDALMTLIRNQTNINWMALVDGAFDFESKPLLGFDDRCHLYDNEKMQELVAASPYLVQFSTANEDVLEKQLMSLLKHRGHRPMLSFITSKNTPLSIIKAWENVTNVSTSDEQSFVLRFADTRVLPIIARILEKSAWAALTKPLNDWIVIDRAGDLLSLPIQQNNITPSFPIVIAEHEMNGLLEDNQADAIINCFYERAPNILPDKKRLAFYEHIISACQLAKKHQVEAFPDVFALASIVCLTEGDVTEKQELIDLLQSKRYESGNLMASLLMLMNEVEEQNEN